MLLDDNRQNSNSILFKERTVCINVELCECFGREIPRLVTSFPVVMDRRESAG